MHRLASYPVSSLCCTFVARYDGARLSSRRAAVACRPMEGARQPLAVDDQYSRACAWYVSRDYGHSSVCTERS